MGTYIKRHRFPFHLHVLSIHKMPAEEMNILPQCQDDDNQNLFNFYLFFLKSCLILYGSCNSKTIKNQVLHHTIMHCIDFTEKVQKISNSLIQTDAAARKVSCC